MSDKEIFEGWRGYWKTINTDLGNDNQYTLGFGFSSKVKDKPFLAVKQGGPVPKDNDEYVVTGMYPPPGWNAMGCPPIGDARDLAFQNGSGWRKSEATGVHAEVILIRAWMNCMPGSTMLDRFNKLIEISDSIYISASQPACWCCAALMNEMGIHYDKWQEGAKPLTGWRHPLSSRTVPNHNIPMNSDSVGLDFLIGASNF